ncbi:MAG TPA: FG-GAP-like repeat-containing protein, partial [Planosporangium sp.]|nr:FG-GAP-like repeat-containing protein [Planosporangium sp.]
RGDGGAVNRAAVRARPAGPTAAGLAPGAVRLRLGRFDAPATDAVARSGVPDGVPLATGFPEPEGARSLSLTRAGLPSLRAVGVTWVGPSDGVSVAVRGRVGTDPWGSWHTAAPTGGSDGAGPGVRQGARLVWLGTGDAVQVTVTSSAAATPDDVTVDLIDPREAPGDAVAVPSVTSVSVDASRVGRPPIHSRAEWGAYERLMNWPPQYAPAVRALAWHDQSVGGDYTETDVPRILRALFYYDAVSRGWGDLGDNVIVDRFGRLWEGRYGGLSRPVVGAHTAGRNAATAGIGVLGGAVPTQAPAPAMAPATEAAARYVAWKLSMGPAVDPRGDATLSKAPAPAKPRPASTPPPVTVARVFATDQAVAATVLAGVRDRAYALMGGWARAETMRRTLAMWSPARATFTELGGAAGVWTGQPGDVPVPADYDGDGQLDLATWSPETGGWTIQNSGGGTTERSVLGQRGDVPVPADYDGDGRAEPATFTPATATWHVRGAPDVVYGKPGDRPAPADYTGDGRADLAVYRAKSGLWEIQGLGRVDLGSPWHIPVPADYDGDGKADPATWSPQSGLWYLRGKPAVRFGNPGDVPVPGQYNGDGKADFAVWRPPARGAATGTWIIRGVGSYPLGTKGDVPTTLG